MALGQAKKFIDQLKSDQELRYRFQAFIASEGYSFALNEIQLTERAVLKERLSKCCYTRDLSTLRGYENWVG